MSGQEWPPYVPPACGHPGVVDVRTFADPASVFECVSCGQTVDANAEPELHAHLAPSDPKVGDTVTYLGPTERRARAEPATVARWTLPQPGRASEDQPNPERPAHEHTPNGDH